MKFEINFTGSRQEKEAKALRATKDYMGTARYLAWRRQIVDFFLGAAGKDRATCAQKYRSIKLALLLSGVQGYWPHRAVARDILSILKHVRNQQTQEG